MMVAVGWRVDDDLESFRAVGPGRCPAILRTDIDGWVAGQTACFDLFEFTAIIVGKEDIVMIERKAFCFGKQCPCHRRKGPLRRGRGSDRATGSSTEHAGSNC